MSTAESGKVSGRTSIAESDDVSPQSLPVDLDSTRSLQARPRRSRNLRSSRAARDAARELKRGSGRRIDTPVRKAFVRPMTSGRDVAPLSLIYKGRGGDVAVKLYLAILWRCATAPWTTSAPARAWATLLDLDDPENAGARRIRNALRALEAAQLVTVASTPGSPNTISILDESGSGDQYRLPSTAYAKKQRAGASKSELAEDMYFKFPTKLWTSGNVQHMSGSAIVMLLILLAEQGGDGSPVWFSTNEFPRRYSISANSRAAGTAELQQLELLEVKSEPLPDPGTRRTPTFKTRRRRKVYTLTRRAQIDEPNPEVSATGPPRRRRVAVKK